MLDLIDETLDQMPFTIEPFVIWACCLFTLGTLMWWNDRFHFLFNHPLIEFLGSITTVSNQAVKRKSIDQRNSLTNVRFLPGCQSHAQRITQPIYGDMNLGTETAATTSQRLCFLTATFFGRRRHMDEHAQRCYQSSHFPCPGRQQSEQAYVPIRLGHTSGQNACRRCSISHILLVIAAIGNHYGLSRARLRQNGGILLHSYRCKHSGLLLGRPELSSIEYLRVSQLT